MINDLLRPYAVLDDSARDIWHRCCSAKLANGDKRESKGVFYCFTVLPFSIRIYDDKCS